MDVMMQGVEPASPETAMISRIRVEARGGSMDACQKVIQAMLEHASVVGYLEGFTPQLARPTEPHFGWVDGMDEWTKLGLPFEGRMAYRFDPEVVEGGLKEYGFEVIEVDNFTPHGLAGHEGSESAPIRTDVTDKVMVLHRRNPVTREHVWEKSSTFGTLGQTHEVGDLSTFNRARHEEYDGFICEVWLQGMTEGGRDQPTRILGAVTSTSVSNATPEVEYVHDLRIGEDIETKIEEVFEKVSLFAAGLRKGRLSKTGDAGAASV